MIGRDGILGATPPMPPSNARATRPKRHSAASISRSSTGASAS
jgi:hypothetical protein